MAKRTIYNRRTGEVRVVDDSELYQYNAQTLPQGATANSGSLSPENAVIEDIAPQTEEEARKGLLETIIEPFANTTRNILGAPIELMRAGAIDKSVKESNEYARKAQELNRRLREEKDPEKKRQLLEESRNLDAGIEKTNKRLDTSTEFKNPFLTDEMLKKASEDPFGYVKDQFKDSAEIMSYGVPIGGSVPGMIKGGLISGGLMGFGRSEDGKELEGTLLGAGTGGVVSPIIGKALPVIGGAIRSGVGKVGGAIKSGVQKEAQQSFLKASPSAFRQAVENHGVDVNKLASKYVPKVNSYEEVIGEASERGYGGILGQQMKSAESKIQNTVKTAGGNIRISIEPFVKELKGEIADLKMIPGNEEKIQALTKLIKNFQTQYKNGLSTKRALDLKRAADSKFGQSVVNEETGSVASVFQKMVANSARKQLKTLFPEIADALDTQSDLYTLMPLINHARAISNTGGSSIRIGKVSNIGINPLTWWEAFVNSSPRVSSRLMQGGQEATEQATRDGGMSLPKILPNGAITWGARTAATRGVTGVDERNQQIQESYTDANNYGNGYQDASNIQSQSEHGASLPSISNDVNTPQTLTGYTPEQLYKAYIQASNEGNAPAASQLRKMWEDETEYREGQSETQDKTVKQAQLQAAADGARQALALLESGNVNVGPVAGRIEGLKSGTIGTSPEQQDFMGTVAIARSALLNAYLGGNIPPAEYERISAGIPTATDPTPTAKQKLLTFIREVERVSDANATPDVITSGSSMPPLY